MSLSIITDSNEELLREDYEEIGQSVSKTNKSLALGLGKSISIKNDVINSSKNNESRLQLYPAENSFLSLHKNNLPMSLSSPLTSSGPTPNGSSPDKNEIATSITTTTSPICNISLNNTNNSNESYISLVLKSSPEQNCDSGYDDTDKSSINSKVSPNKSSDDDKSPNCEVERLKKIINEKDKQLEIAAQYGITLLQKNAELQSLIDANTTEDVLTKLEQLTNEKHQMKMQHESTNHEYEVIINDLRNDIVTLSGGFEDERRIWKILETRVEMGRMVELKSNECKLLSCALDEAQNKINQLEKEKDNEYNKIKNGINYKSKKAENEHRLQMDV
ncbi:hypothetical protein HELRODRAFT_168780 [Helobdella robusta]|uniref:Uncharacterized protein n=1 Tax=Helobdella robusta TaxID=6412 RepID=T1F0Y5_HELRO|nr:hypothetical protein HELRODRAFT_168780 [Helobdella robusta]ESO08863.1 hypothetical protein HELRODRAFT_168780 [Helobdella robusta]